MNKTLTTSFLTAIGLSAALLSGCSDGVDAPKSLEQQIDDKCHAWALQVSENGQYDSHTGHRIAGCRIAFMINTPSLQEEGIKQADALRHNPEDSETLYYADQISLCLKGFTC